MIRKKELFFNMLLLFCVCVIFFILLEVSLRFLGIASIENEPSVDIVKHESYSPFLVFGPNWNEKIELEGGKLATWNKQGLRREGELPLEKKKNEIRIFALGGSTTENLANSENVHYSQMAERELNTHHQEEILVLNAGKSAYSSAHTLIRLQFDILPLKPDIITVMHNINDLTVNFFPQERENDYANKYLVSPYYQKVSFEREFLKKSNTIVFLYKRFQDLKQNFLYEKVELNEDGVYMHSNAIFTDEEIPLYAKDSFRRNLVSIVRIAKANNVTPVLMSQPAFFTDEKIALSLNFQPYNSIVIYPKKEQYEKLFIEYNRLVEEVAEEEGAYFIDMYKLLEKKEEYFVDMVHYSPEGIEAFSQIYAKELNKIIEKEGLESISN